MSTERIDHAAALHRHAAAVVQAAGAALDSHVPMPRTDLAEQHDLVHRLRQAAARLVPGWLGADLPAQAPLGEQRRPEFVRIGSGDAGFPVIVPLLGTGHLTFSADSRDARVAGVLRCLLLRLLATAPAGTLIVRAVDAVGGALFAPFGVLADAGLMPPPAIDREGLRSVLSEAEHWTRPDRPDSLRRPATKPRRRDRTMLLVIASLPSTILDEDLARLIMLAQTGPAAGLHLVIAGRPPGTLASSMHVALHSTHALLGELSVPVQLDPDPGAELVQRVCADLADRLAETGHTHLMDLVPDPDHWWSESSAEGLSTTVGLAGDTPISLHFNDLTPHWLIGGRAHSGKTAFLTNVLYGLCTRYDPDELALYLLDFSPDGALRQFIPTQDDPSWLPQAVEVAVGGDRPSGLAVLRSLGDELARRLASLNDAGASRFAALRASGAAVPRIVCVVDEFHTLLAGTDEIAAEATKVLESVAKQGRSVGIHLVMCAQAPRGNALFGQFLVRVAVPGGGDVLEANNDSAASLPMGCAVVNTAGGLGGPRGATRGHEKTVRFPDPQGDPQVLTALRQRLWQARDPSSIPPQVHPNGATRER